MTHTSESLRRAFKYFYPDELPALKELARSLPNPNPRIINIGAGAGTSALALMESRRDIFVTTIDTQLEDSPFGCLTAEERVLNDAGYGNLPGMIKRYTQIHGDSKEVGKEYQAAGWKFDMVFIDGDHSEEGCRGDILAWLPNIKPGGIIAVHDYLKSSLWTEDYNLLKPSSDLPHPKDWPGVDKAVDDLLFRGGYELIAYIESLVAFRIPE